MSLAALKTITQRVRTRTITISELCNQIRVDELYDYATQEWIEYIRYDILETLGSNEFWIRVCGITDFNTAKYQWRFFPVDSNIEDVTRISNDVFQNTYSNWTGRVIKSANGRWIPQWMRTGTNLGIVHVSRHDQHAAIDLDPILLALDVTHSLPNLSTHVEILCALCVNYDTCGLVLRHPQLLAHIKQVLGMSEYRDIVHHMLFYSMFILRHEESVCKSPTTLHRWVFTLDGARELAYLHNNTTTSTPLLTNWLIGDAPAEMFTPFYLYGERRVVSLDEFHRRFDMVVDPAVRRLQRWSNVTVVGSVLVSCIADNKLNDPPRRLVYDDDYTPVVPPSIDHSWNIRCSDDEGFMRRHHLYYPLEGNRAMCSDIDIAVHCDRGFDKQVMEMIVELNRERAIPYRWRTVPTATGFKYHVYHPVTHLKFEIFRTSRPPMEMVSQYHVACVRMYYDFKQVYMTRNCAAALITGINESYNWFSNNKNPMDVILKYAQRGYTTILNIKELECVDQFCRTGERWQYARGNSADTYSSIVGNFDHNHIFFRVDAVPRGIRLGLEADTTVQYDTRALYRFNNKDLPLVHRNALVRYEGECVAAPVFR